MVHVCQAWSPHGPGRCFSNKIWSGLCFAFPSDEILLTRETAVSLGMHSSPQRPVPSCPQRQARLHSPGCGHGKQEGEAEKAENEC